MNLGGTMGDTMEYIKTPRKKFEPVNDNDIEKTSLYNDEQEDEQETLKLLVHDQAKKKIGEYGKKIAKMEQKYRMDFSAFEKQVHLRTGKEDFEEWDDFILWESYVRAYRYWEQFL